MTAHHHRSVVSYVRRSSRLTTGQQRAWSRRWHELGRTASDLDNEGGLNLREWFGRSAPLVVEIGTGMGETTAQLAAAAPEVNYLAIEVYTPGLAQLILHAEKLGVSNLRLLQADAVPVLSNVFAQQSVSEFRILFPDPWPKKKHHKRRLIQPEVAALLASRLRPGGRLWLATDWADYAEQMRTVCDNETGLHNEYPHRAGGWAPRPSWRPVTKFERRAHEEHRHVHDLAYRTSAEPVAGSSSEG